MARLVGRIGDRPEVVTEPDWPNARDAEGNLVRTGRMQPGFFHAPHGLERRPGRQHLRGRVRDRRPAGSPRACGRLMGAGAPYRCSANVHFLFGGRPLADQLRAAAEAGFHTVELADPYQLPLDDLADLLTELELQVDLFNLPFGNMAAGDRGYAGDPARRDAVPIGRRAVAGPRGAARRPEGERARGRAGGRVERGGPAGVPPREPGLGRGAVRRRPVRASSRSCSTPSRRPGSCSRRWTWSAGSWIRSPAPPGSSSTSTTSSARAARSSPRSAPWRTSPPTSRSPTPPGAPSPAPASSTSPTCSPRSSPPATTGPIGLEYKPSGRGDPFAWMPAAGAIKV